jgi:hypothetical protein
MSEVRVGLFRYKYYSDSHWVDLHCDFRGGGEITFEGDKCVSDLEYLVKRLKKDIKNNLREGDEKFI